MEKYETKLKKVLEDMSYALNHIEDIVADNREVIIKLVILELNDWDELYLN